MERVLACRGRGGQYSEEESGLLWEFVSATLLSFKLLQCQQGRGDIRGNSSSLSLCISNTECACPFYSLKTCYFTEPRITMLPWKRKKKNLSKTHEHADGILVSCCWQVEKLQRVGLCRQTEQQISAFLLQPPPSLHCLPAFIKCLVSPANRLGNTFWHIPHLSARACACETTCWYICAYHWE